VPVCVPAPPGVFLPVRHRAAVSTADFCIRFRRLSTVIDGLPLSVTGVDQDYVGSSERAAIDESLPAQFAEAAMLATQLSDFESFANALGGLPTQPPVQLECEPSPSPIDVDTKAIVHVRSGSGWLQRHPG